MVAELPRPAEPDPAPTVQNGAASGETRPKPGSYSEQVLIARAQDGDHAAFEAIFNQYQTAIYRVALGHGRFAVVDATEAARVSALRWHLVKGYAAHKYRSGGKVKTLYLHRFILGAPEEIDVDHRNGLYLDCRRDNLRLATEAENGQNRQRANRNSGTGLRGTYWHKRKGFFVGQVRVDGRSYSRGGFATAEAAAQWAQATRREHMPYSPEAAGVSR
jgi:hypothetical protein